MLQINALLARDEGELALFEAEDAKLRAAELAAWGASSGASGDAAGYHRVATEQEVAALAAAAEEQAVPPDADAGREFGRGKRAREEVRYAA